MPLDWDGCVFSRSRRSQFVHARGRQAAPVPIRDQPPGERPGAGCRPPSCSPPLPTPASSRPPNRANCSTAPPAALETNREDAADRDDGNADEAKLRVTTTVGLGRSRLTDKIRSSCNSVDVPDPARPRQRGSGCEHALYRLRDSPASAAAIRPHPAQAVHRACTSMRPPPTSIGWRAAGD